MNYGYYQLLRENYTVERNLVILLKIQCESENI